MLLAEVAFVGGNVQPRYHLSGLLGGHAVTDFFRFLFEELLIRANLDPVFMLFFIPFK